MSTMQQTDVLIIGAGPSGSSAAALLRQKGYQVTVIEKQYFPAVFHWRIFIAAVYGVFGRSGFVGDRCAHMPMNMPFSLKMARLF